MSTEKPKTCVHCGKGGLHWESTVAGWRLHTSEGYMHACPKFQKRDPADTPITQRQAELEKISEEIAKKLNETNGWNV